KKPSQPLNSEASAGVAVQGPREQLVDRNIRVPVASGLIVSPHCVNASLSLLLVLRDNALADRLFGLLISAAVEVACIVCAAGTVVDCFLRERTQWTGPAPARSQNAIGRHTVLNPVYHRFK